MRHHRSLLPQTDSHIHTHRMPFREPTRNKQQRSSLRGPLVSEARWDEIPVSSRACSMLLFLPPTEPRRLDRAPFLAPYRWCVSSCRLSYILQYLHTVFYRSHLRAVQLRNFVCTKPQGSKSTRNTQTGRVPLPNADPSTQRARV